MKQNEFDLVLKKEIELRKRLRRLLKTPEGRRLYVGWLETLRPTKEQQMSMAVRMLSDYPVIGYPDAQDFSKIGQLLCLAYEDFDRFVATGVPNWREYLRLKMYGYLKEDKKV